MLSIRPARLEDESGLLPIDRVSWTADVSPGVAPDPPEPMLGMATLADVLVVEEDGVVGG